jgi:branched-chain amino acid transport system substrate-binding protein
VNRRLSAIAAVALAAALVSTACSRGTDPIRVGAIYPLSGSQGPGGVDEYRGVNLAADLVNADGGVQGRRIQLVPVDAAGADAAPAAVDDLAGRGVRFVLGSYGSEISQPAAAEAARKGLLFWETGAVSSMPGPSGGRYFFRVAPSGALLGSSAVAFVAQRLAPLLHRSVTSLRFAVANVDDVYGSQVALGAVQEIRALGLPFGGRFSYGLAGFDPAKVVREIAQAKPDVLFVSAYLDDAVKLRKEMVRQRLHLVASIGTSSSYCMPMFGKMLGSAAVGLFASDKPDSDALNPEGLTPSGRALLARARAAYRDRYHREMSAPALAGFSAAWAMFHSVMPVAGTLTPASVAEAALRARVPQGGLPNGSGLEFAGPGAADAGANLRAVSVIWEWTGLDRREVVWPPRFATTSIAPIPIQP